MNCWLIGVTLQCLQPNNSLTFIQNYNYEQPSNVFVYIPPEIKARVAARIRDRDSECMYGFQWAAADGKWRSCK